MPKTATDDRKLTLADFVADPPPRGTLSDSASGYLQTLDHFLSELYGGLATTRRVLRATLEACDESREEVEFCDRIILESLAEGACDFQCSLRQWFAPVFEKED